MFGSSVYLMQKNFLKFLVLIFICGVANVNYSQKQISKKEAAIKTHQYIAEIANKSFPRINLKKIKIESFTSESVFFKARFSFGRYFMCRRMRHLVFVNPKVFNNKAPEIAIKAILAHELAHVLYYTRKNRVQLVGLTRLISKGFTRKFERKADVEAIARGYGRGLIIYRKWLYKNIPRKKIRSKKRNYFSPEEIELMLEILKQKPTMIDVWRKRVPKNLEAIRKSV